MALIVEDGTIVTGADTYVSRADAITYAANRGVTLADSTTTDAMIRKACDWLESYADKFKGERVERDQPLSWPRDGVVIEGFEWSTDEIPRQVINCQLAALIEIAAGNDPFNPPSALPVVSEKVAGAVEVAYANPGASAKMTKDRDYRAILRLLLKTGGLTMVQRA
jgi:hypothetical protein